MDSIERPNKGPRGTYFQKLPVLQLRYRGWVEINKLNYIFGQFNCFILHYLSTTTNFYVIAHDPALRNKKWYFWVNFFSRECLTWRKKYFFFFWKNDEFYQIKLSISIVLYNRFLNNICSSWSKRTKIPLKWYPKIFMPSIIIVLYQANFITWIKTTNFFSFLQINFQFFLVWLLKFKYNDESIFFMLLVEKKTSETLLSPIQNNSKVF